MHYATEGVVHSRYSTVAQRQARPRKAMVLLVLLPITLLIGTNRGQSSFGNVTTAVQNESADKTAQDAVVIQSWLHSGLKTCLT